jgi:hypothetical protein
MIRLKTPARFVSAAAALAALAGAATFMVDGVYKLFYPYALNLGEAPLAQTIRLVRAGTMPYHDLSGPPFSLVPYGPVYLALSAWAQSLFGANPMAGGRLICLAASVSAAVMIGWLVFGAQRSRMAAVGSGCFFLTLPFVARWGVQVNVDMTSVAVELAALCCFAAYAASGHVKRRYFWIGTLAAVLAIYTKSSAAAAAGAFTFYLLFSRRWRDLFIFAAAAGGAVLLVYAVLNQVTSGGYFLHTTQEIGRRVFFVRFIFDYWRAAVTEQPLNVAAAAAALLTPAFWRRSDKGMLLDFYLLFTVLVTVSLGKQGSDTNYLLPFAAASSLAIGRWWGCGVKGAVENHSRILQVVAIAAAVSVLALAAPTIRPAAFNPTRQKASRAEQIKFYDGLSKVISQFPDPVISWDMSLLIANGRPIYFEPFPMAQAAYSGVWDQTPILTALRERKVKLIITYFWAKAIKQDRNFTPEFVEELRANYRLVGNIKIPWADNQRLFLYTPNKTEG